MKKFSLLVLSTFLSIYVNAQSKEFGLALGAANFLGDLGGGQGIGNMLPKDLDLRATRPAICALYRQNLNPYMSLRFNLLYAKITANDDFTPGDLSDGLNSGDDYRYLRNLSFQSDVIEFSAQYEQNFMRYEIGRRRYRFAPYALAGIGGFYYNPKVRPWDEANQGYGGWTEVRQLGLEGQYLDQYPDRRPYSNFAICFPLGFGFKYNVSENWSLGFEYAYRFTMTDYLDDVSRDYVPFEYFQNATVNGQPRYTPQELAIIQGSIRKSNVVDPNGTYDYVTGDFQQRGDPSDNDHYLLAGLISLTYTVKKGRIYCPKF